MLYNIGDNNFSKIIKQLIFWLSLASMSALFIFLLDHEVKPSKRPMTIEIDIRNKVNICLPEEDYNLKAKRINDFENNK
ncbi:MAG TPA: hypothetical protein VI861_00380 [Rickettsiales bacterium]|nr:hypothetical protein [Rickettsiales bacterium]